MHAPTQVTITDIATPRANSETSWPTSVRPTSVMATLPPTAPKCKGSLTTMPTSICTMGNPLEMPIMTTRGG